MVFNFFLYLCPVLIDNAMKILTFKRFILFICGILGILVLGGCHDTDHYLELADRYLYEDKLDSAKMSLEQLEEAKLNADDEVAKYNLLKTEYLYRVYSDTLTDAMIDKSIAYYQKVNDAENLANCYYYKARIVHDKNIKKGILLMKEAERRGNETKDIKLKHKILESLTDWNLNSGEYGLGYDYAKKNLAISLQDGNKNWLAYAYNFLYVLSDRLNKKEERLAYLKKATAYINDVPESDRAQFYTMIAGYHYENGNTDKATEYYHKSLSTQKTAPGYLGLAVICYKKGEYEKANSYFKEAIERGETSYKVAVMDVQRNLYFNDGKIKEAYEICNQEIQNTRYLDAERAALDLRNLQYKLDKEVVDLKRQKTIMNTIAVICSFFLFGLSLFLYIKYKKNKMKQQIYKDQLMINNYEGIIQQLESEDARKKIEIAEYNAKISELESSQVAQNQEAIADYKEKISQLEMENGIKEKTVKEYKEKTKTLKDDQNKRIGDGMKLYKRLFSGENISQWRKKDYEDFIQYFALTEVAFMAKMESSYRNLTPRNQTFLILHDKGWGKYKVMETMGMSASTYRTTKFRVNQSKIED